MEPSSAVRKANSGLTAAAIGVVKADLWGVRKGLRRPRTEGGASGRSRVDDAGDAGTVD